jgi:hypothetical protein
MLVVQQHLRLLRRRLLCARLYSTTVDTSTAPNSSSSTAKKMRAAIARGDLNHAQSLFARSVLNPKSEEDAAAALGLLSQTAKATRDDALLQALGGIQTRSRETVSRRLVGLANAVEGEPALKELVGMMTSEMMARTDYGDFHDATHLKCLNIVLRKEPALGKKVLRAMKSLGLSPDHYTVNAILQSNFSKQSKSEEVSLNLKLLLRLIDKDNWAQPKFMDSYTVALLSSEMYHKKVEAIDALALVRAFLSAGIGVGHQSYEQVLRLCATQGHPELARQVVREMKLLGLPVERRALVRGYSSIAKDIFQRHITLEQILDLESSFPTNKKNINKEEGGGNKQQQLQQQQDGLFQQSSADSHTSNNLRSEVEFWEGVTREALDISAGEEISQSRGVTPDLLAVRFAALGAANMSQKVLGEFEALLDRGSALLVESRGTVSNAALAVASRNSTTAGKTLEYLDRLSQQSSFKRDVYTYNAVLNAVATSPATLGSAMALDLLHQMEEENIWPDLATVYIFSKITRNCVRDNEGDLAVHMLELLQKSMRESPRASKGIMQYIENRLKVLCDLDPDVTTTSTTTEKISALEQR